MKSTTGTKSVCRSIMGSLVRSLIPSARSLRVGAYGTFAFGLLAICAARSVYADVRAIGLASGHELAKLGDLTAGAYRVRVNGAVIHRSSAHTDQPVTTVLDRYEAHCRSNPGALGRAMQDIPSALSGHLDAPGSGPLGASAVRDEVDGRGMVVCFVDREDAPAAPLVERLRELSETGDLSKLGRVRYVYAEPSSGGGTRVVTLWSDDALNLNEMFPVGGDAPGTDSETVPRPPDARRTLSAAVDRHPASVRIYESRAPRAAVEEAYDAALVSKGFTKVAPAGGCQCAAYLRADTAQVVVSFVESSGRTTATVIEDGPENADRGVTR